jgi:imidazolonepropionase-like amidohydrolase
VPGPVLDVMLPRIRDNYLRTRVTIESQADSTQDRLLRKEMALELAFARAGGTLLAGTDPTGYGGVIAGFANHRELELLVEAGFSPEEAIRIGTLNGARYLGRADRIGSVETGKSADLVVVAGDPSRRIRHVENVQIVFKDGIGYDPAKLIDSVKGVVGLH